MNYRNNCHLRALREKLEGNLLEANRSLHGLVSEKKVIELKKLMSSLDFYSAIKKKNHRLLRALV